MATNIPTTEQAKELAAFYKALEAEELPEALIHELTAVAARGWANGSLVAWHSVTA